MDKRIVAAEETDHRGNEYLASASECAGSPVQINSVAIDLDCAMGETKSLEHEHFSILGFAAEMRKKDRKACLPFASEGGDDVNLPPLPVPKFRWWQCSDCVLDIFDQKSTLGMIVAVKSDDGTSSFRNAVEEDGLLVQYIDVRDNGGRNSFPRITTEANQVQMKELSLNNSADKNASTGPYNPGNATSSSDSDIPFSSLPPKRKLKLRSLADIINGDNKNLVPTPQIEADLNHQARLESSLDAPKAATKTLHRRRKNVLEEEEEEMDHRIATAKRLKRHVTESDNNNTFRSFGSSEAESERDNSRTVLFDSRLSSKTHQNKARKRRSLDINRKTRRDDTESRTIKPMVNLHKYPPVYAGTRFGDMVPFFKNSLSRQQMDSISDMSKGTGVEEGRHYSPYTPPSNKGDLGNCNNKNKEKITLDLSLSSYKSSGEMNSEKQESSGTHTWIPDLNESFVEKTFTTEGLQLSTLHTNLDMFASSGNSTVDVEPGKASDDIPMEIVELLAKNQHERANGNSSKHLGPDGIHSNNPFNVPSPYIEGTPCNFIPISMSSGTLCVYPNPSKNCDLDRGQFRHFGPLTPGQHSIELCSGPNIVSRPRPSDGAADLLWPPRRNNMTFDVSQPGGSEDQRYKSKNVKRAVTYRSLVREGGIGTSYKSAVSMDAYSNDTIPAMQLLSLMDQTIISGSSSKVGGTKNLLDRQFSPCNHHPRPINKNGNPNDPFVSSSSFFGQSNRTNDFPTLLNGVRCSGDLISSKSFFPHAAPMPPHKGNAKPIDLAGPSNISAQPLRTSPTLEVCMLNRNPADFSIPDARNEFMISVKDLNLKKKNFSKEKSRPGNAEGQKKRRARNGPSRKESSIK